MNKTNTKLSEVATPANTRDEAKKKLDKAFKKDELIEHLLDVNDKYIAIEQEVLDIKAITPEGGSHEQATIIKQQRMKIEGLNETVTSLMQQKKRQAATWQPSNLKENSISAYFKRDIDKESKDDANKVKVLVKPAQGGKPAEYVYEKLKCWNSLGERERHLRFTRFHQVRIKHGDEFIEGVAKIDHIIPFHIHIGQCHDKTTGKPTGNMWLKGQVYQDDDMLKKQFVSPSPATAPENAFTEDEDGKQTEVSL